MYGNGRSVPQDDAEAVRWYRLAAEQGNALAQFNLGVMYFAGRGVPQDHAEAVRWYRLGAEQGIAAAQFFLGVAYSLGRGIPQDYAEAVRWLSSGRRAGATPSPSHPSGLRTASVGACRRTTLKPVRWSRLAAEQGHADAQFFLGVAYGTGRGRTAGLRFRTHVAERCRRDRPRRCSQGPREFRRQHDARPDRRGASAGAGMG